MAINVTDIGDGKWLAVNDVSGQAWTTTVEESIERLQQVSDDIQRQSHRVSKWQEDLAPLNQIKSDITSGTITPLVGTNPTAYLIDKQVITGEQLNQNIMVIESNIQHIRDVILKDLGDSLEEAEYVFDQIVPQSPPAGAKTKEFTFEGLPQDIAQKPSLTGVAVQSDIDAPVKFVTVKVTVTHPSGPTEPLLMWLGDPSGFIRRFAAQDFPSVETEQTFQMGDFIGKNALGTWQLIAQNDVSNETDRIVKASIIIYY